jgi:hypothetical protein
MNERIYELAEQAGFENGHQDRYGNSLSCELEKFAELIVRECAKLVEDHMDPQNAWITPAFIKEHFGVEE